MLEILTVAWEESANSCVLRCAAVLVFIPTFVFSWVSLRLPAHSPVELTAACTFLVNHIVFRKHHVGSFCHPSFVSTLMCVVEEFLLHFRFSFFCLLTWPRQLHQSLMHYSTKMFFFFIWMKKNSNKYRFNFWDLRPHAWTSPIGLYYHRNSFSI